MLRRMSRDPFAPKEWRRAWEHAAWMVADEYDRPKPMPTLGRDARACGIDAIQLEPRPLTPAAKLHRLLMLFAPPDEDGVPQPDAGVIDAATFLRMAKDEP